MAYFKYKAKQGPKQVLEGTVEAKSEKEALEKIHQLGYIPLKLQEVTDAQEALPIVSRGGGSFHTHISSRSVTLFSRQLASLLKAGVPILASLNILAEQTDNQNFKKILRNIRDAVKSGATFSVALAEYPNVFSSMYIAMVRTGENSGVLSDVLLRIAEYRNKQEETISRFRMALAYPILMALVGIGTITFMLTFVMPRLMKIFIDLGQQLPWPTRVVIFLSKLLQQWWFWIIFVSVVTIVFRELRNPKRKPALSALVLKVPLLGHYIVKSELGKFSRTLEILLKSGIPILRAIQVSAPVVGNFLLREKLISSGKELEQGGSFGKSLRISGIFPAFMTNLIMVGEESGKLSDALGEIATSYEYDTDEALKIMTNLLEPLMILGMGLIVGFIVIAMLLPIFEINVFAR